MHGAHDGVVFGLYSLYDYKIRDFPFTYCAVSLIIARFPKMALLCPIRCYCAPQGYSKPHGHSATLYSITKFSNKKRFVITQNVVNAGNNLMSSMAISFYLLYFCNIAWWPKHVAYTYFLTPWSRILLEKLTGFQPVKKFHAFYGTRRFITAFTSARHLSLS